MRAACVKTITEFVCGITWFAFADVRYRAGHPDAASADDLAGVDLIWAGERICAGGPPAIIERISAIVDAAIEPIWCRYTDEAAERNFAEALNEVSLWTVYDRGAVRAAASGERFAGDIAHLVLLAIAAVPSREWVAVCHGVSLAQVAVGRVFLGLAEDKVCFEFLTGGIDPQDWMDEFLRLGPSLGGGGSPRIEPGGIDLVALRPSLWRRSAERVARFARGPLKFRSPKDASADLTEDPGLVAVEGPDGEIPPEIQPDLFGEIVDMRADAHGYDVPLERLDFGDIYDHLNVGGITAPGEAPEPPRDPRVPDSPDLIEAECLVTAPPRPPLGKPFAIEFWLSPSVLKETMRRAALKTGLAVERAERSGLSLGVGERLTIVLDLKGFDIDEPVQSFAWIGRVINLSFGVRSCEGAAPGMYAGKIRLLVANAPIATLAFNLQLCEDGQAGGHAALESKIGWVKRGFASYASADRVKVLLCVQGMQKMGADVFVDIVDLRSGDRWQDTLTRQIGVADRFYLFWSESARESVWVEKEWRYALETRGIDFIDPVPLVNPAMVPPPAELSAKHFNDMAVVYIAAHDYWNQMQPPNAPH